MKIFVTGAAGFIGSALCQKLKISGNEVMALDNYSNYYDVGLKNLRVKELLQPLGISVTNLDISNKQELNKLIKVIKPDVVVNLAAQAGVRLTIQENSKYVESNLVGFSNILTVTVENNIPLFLYASSSSVYGDSAALPYSELDNNLHPKSFYGATKLANELLTPTIIKNSSTAARGLRFFTVYGPWGRPDMAYFRMIANTLVDSEFEFFGDGSVERDFTYISDAVDAVTSLISELETRNPGYSDVVNLGGGKPLSMNYLMDVVSATANKKVNFRQFKSNLNDSKKTMSDATYITKLIGTKPEIRLEEGIVETLNWSKQNEIINNLSKWVKSVK
jgi:UDP-glucuronate 4-epimerase